MAFAPAPQPLGAPIYGGQVTAAYAPPAYAPQGMFGDFLGKYAGPVGGWIGGAAGSPQLGQQVGGLAGQFAKFLPFEAGPVPVDSGPAYAPQGILGSWLGGVVGRPLGGLIGGAFGNEQLGQQIGGAAGGIGGGFLPFQATPVQAAPVPAYAPPAYAPQGMFGDFLGKYAGPVGGWIGGAAGSPQLGQQVGGLAGQFAKFLPFEAGPVPAYAPQGMFGDFLGSTPAQWAGGSVARPGARSSGNRSAAWPASSRSSCRSRPARCRPTPRRGCSATSWGSTPAQWAGGSVARPGARSSGNRSAAWPASSRSSCRSRPARCRPTPRRGCSALPGEVRRPSGRVDRWRGREPAARATGRRLGRPVREVPAVRGRPGAG